MKQREYSEGKQALENFEEGMKVLFKVPKNAVVQAERKKGKVSSRVQSVRKPKRSDKD
jgi:hypothetical protein